MDTDFIYLVQGSNGDIYWVDDPTTILDGFGTVEAVTRYRLVDPEDITDEVNGGYLRE